jgi:hypothetical protein
LASSKSSEAKTFIAGSGDCTSRSFTSAVTETLSVWIESWAIFTVISEFPLKATLMGCSTGRNPAPQP